MLMLQARFSAYLTNSAWMLAEQFLRLVSGVLVGIYIARYLGPEQFGVLNYVLAITAFVFVIARLGMDAVLVRELAQHADNAGKLLGTAMTLMLLAALVCYFLMVSVLIFVSEPLLIKGYIALAGASVFLAAFYAFDFYFQARVKAKLGAIVKCIVISFMVLIKIVMLWRDVPLLGFVVVHLIEHFLIAIGLGIMFFRNRPPALDLAFDGGFIKPLLQSAWPMLLAGLSSLLYMRVDQLMLRHMVDMEAVGIYSAASRIYEAWILFPFVLSVSLLPALVALKKRSPQRFEMRLQQLFSVLIACSMFAALIAWLFGDVLMLATFGRSYQESVVPLQLLMVAAIFTAVHSVTIRYLTVQHREIKVASRTLIAALLNFVANALLIPIYGPQGAALATLITMFFIAYVMDYLDADLRQLARIKRLALLPTYFWKGKEHGGDGHL
ncbi:flippase [Halomonas sp.]|uniref:flippase n=1 Tax=Halomonas sp. TaxID=1486246 RepID=UPI00384E6E75